jgi:two-component sensor histidine kinase
MSSLERIELPRHMAQASRRDPDSAIEFRQLRHQTKNALQRLIVQINQQSVGRALTDDLERRILLSVSISDALFGFTRAPDPLKSRLRSLGESMVQLLAKPEQVIQLSVQCEGVCPEQLSDTIVRIAHEMIGNAIKHGMDLVLKGTIMVTLTSQPGGPTTLVVRDDGWGRISGHPTGEGYAIMSDLAATFRGRVARDRRGSWTEASATFPPDESAGLSVEAKRGPSLTIILVLVAVTLGLIYVGQTYLDPLGVMKHASLCIGSAILLAGLACAVQAGR